METPHNLDLPEYLTVDEVAKILRVQPLTVRQYIKQNKLDGIKPGGGRKWLIPRASLIKFIDASWGPA